MLSIPVRVTDIAADAIWVVPLHDRQDCPKCVRGEGCGNRPWFQGFIRKNRPIILPRQQNGVFRIGDNAALQCPPAVINRLALFTFALPVFVWLAALFILRNHHDALALLTACAASAAAFRLSRRYCTRLIAAQLRLTALPSDKGQVRKYG